MRTHLVDLYYQKRYLVCNYVYSVLWDDDVAECEAANTNSLCSASESLATVYCECPRYGSAGWMKRTGVGRIPL